jgi:hypothetical protein
MPNARTRDHAPLPDEVKADYSYSQWRQAQMQQLERNYRAVCNRTRQLVSGTTNDLEPGAA